MKTCKLLVAACGCVLAAQAAEIPSATLAADPRYKARHYEIEIPEGAFYAFPSVKKFGIAPSDLARRLILEAGVAITPGEAFGSQEHIRISYCCSMADLEEGLDRLESFLSGLETE